MSSRSNAGVATRRKKDGRRVDANSPNPLPSTRGLRLVSRRVYPRALVGPIRCSGGSHIDALALPLGMSIAAFVAQVLEKNKTTSGNMSADYLSLLCTSAVRESLTDVFGDRTNCFVNNFEKSFHSTLRTITLINKSSGNRGRNNLCDFNREFSDSDVSSPVSPNKGVSAYSCGTNSSQTQVVLPTIKTEEHLGACEDVSENTQINSMNQELVLHQRIKQGATCVSSTTLGSQGSVISQSMVNTWERSVLEQARYNDLKACELSLQMKRLKLKEEQLSLHTHSNRMERVKLFMGISTASFKADKFRTQLEETRHAELLKRCVDCLVAGLLIMSAALTYGAYVHSYKRIIEATESCNLPEEEPKSWWVPKSVSSFNSGMHILRCQVQVVSRMLFGLLVILSVAYLLLQRSGNMKQTMPLTFIILLLGGVCGFTGMLCVDTLGGDAYLWLFYWEAQCLLHFFSNVWISALFVILHGPITVSKGERNSSVFPYWLRRSLFYVSIVFFLPLLCGLMPFAGLREWRDHFFLLVSDYLLPSSGD